MGGNAETTIMLTDTPQMIHDKIMKHAKSGGRQTLEEHRRLGADLEVDIPYQWLRFFMEDDDELKRIELAYGSG
jgi:tryptophanyl-tRNA synthetase